MLTQFAHEGLALASLTSAALAHKNGRSGRGQHDQHVQNTDSVHTCLSKGPGLDGRKPAGSPVAVVKPPEPPA